MGVELPLRVVVTILECCVTFSGVKLSIRSFVLFIKRVPQEEIKSLNFQELHEWRIKNESVLMSKSERHDVLEAKQKELKNWIDHDVYEEVEDKGQNYISVRWLMTEKSSDGKLIVKVRLVACGYEEENKDSLRTDSPTISKDNL